MNIFISYSASDTHAVQQIAQCLEGYGTVNYWAEKKEPGKEAWPLIFTWIDAADLVFVLITGKTLVRAMSVGQEIGRSKAQGKFIVPLVEPGISTSELGVLAGLTYIQLDPSNPDTALKTTQEVVEKRRVELVDNQAKTVLAIGAVLALFAIFSD